MSPGSRPAGRAREGIARHGRLRRRGPGRTIAAWLLSAVAVVVVSAVVVGGVAVWDLANAVKPGVHLIGETDEPKQPVPGVGSYQGPLNLLIAVSDSRSGQGKAWGPLSDSSGIGNNDVTMLLHIGPDHKQATLVSFPRDLMIPIPSCPTGNGGWTAPRYNAQLNSTLAEGGLACTVLTIKQLTGIDIPYAGMIKFSGVVALSNALGGVNVCVKGGIDDPKAGNLHLTPGMHSLKGKRAAQFLRTRHGLVGGGDLPRISNQQVFLSALVRQVTSDGTLTNPATVWKLAKAALDNIRFSSSLQNVGRLYQIAMILKGLDLDHALMVQYPVLTDPANANRVVPDTASAKVLMDAIASNQPMALEGGTGQGSVPETPAETPGATDSATPGATSTSTDAVQLPENVHGQAVSEETCSNGAG